MKDQKEKRFSLSTEEQENIKRLSRVHGDLRLQLQGLEVQLDIEMLKVKKRVGLSENDQVKFDSQKMEIVLVPDTKIEIASK